jgi:hypothetical protein
MCNAFSIVSKAVAAANRATAALRSIAVLQADAGANADGNRADLVRPAPETAPPCANRFRLSGPCMPGSLTLVARPQSGRGSLAMTGVRHACRWCLA